MKKPVIGIMGSICRRPSIVGTVSSAFVNEAYCKAIILNGGIPFIIPSMIKKEDLPCLLDMCDGLLFPGGDDVDPHIYGEEIHMLCGTVNRQEDELWIEGEHIAEEKGLPVLGICKGMQLVNVARGGSLYQDLSEFSSEHLLHFQQQSRDYLIHKVSIRQDSMLSKILDTDQIYTNTMHHQCVKRAAADLKVTAYTSDSIPEAMESIDGRILLVQWHPEELVNSEPRMNKLFGWLVDKATAKEESV
jgi:putative glutamine amidotransferase